MKLIDLAGKRIGRLTVVRRAISHVAKNGRRRARWLCRCQCGKMATVSGDGIRSGHVQSCGCYRRENSSRMLSGNKFGVLHGMSGTKEHQAWLNMMYRCYYRAHRSWPNYGGRGIGVCARWRKSFIAFYADVGPAPSPAHTLDRRNNNRGYTPGNVRWATRKEQIANRRRNREKGKAGITV